MLTQFKQSESYKEIKEELENFVLKNQSRYIRYSNVLDLREESRAKDMPFKKALLYKRIVPEEFSKSGCKKAATQLVRKKISDCRDYFTPDKTGNIAEQLGKIYFAAICTKFQECRDKMFTWHKAANIDLFGIALLLHADDAYMYMPMLSFQKISSDIAELIEEYVNRNILTKCGYGKNFHVQDLAITYDKEKLLANQQAHLNPLVESIKKLVGNYYIWNYTIDFDSEMALYDKVNEEARLCAEDFFRTGYAQQLATSFAKDFIDKIENDADELHDKFRELQSEIDYS